MSADIEHMYYKCWSRVEHWKRPPQSLSLTVGLDCHLVSLFHGHLSRSKIHVLLTSSWVDVTLSPTLPGSSAKFNAMHDRLQTSRFTDNHSVTNEWYLMKCGSEWRGMMSIFRVLSQGPPSGNTPPCLEYQNGKVEWHSMLSSAPSCYMSVDIYSRYELTCMYLRLQFLDYHAFPIKV